ncbi:MAG TPA: nucleotidyl transferase AbiEii/AbiGii toxin family protein [Gammaproteobacteria bacterium]|nr:nucleotidyl transferase AbiEii/AbiGii toxin family protein [Gammaproteobacteria bacterium]
MIPINMIKEWRQQAPWVFQSQVEQDLILSRALIVLYQDELIQETLAFRGGTALNKLFIKPAARYSEDLDFVQVNDELIGHILTAIRKVLDPWLGVARWKQGPRSVKLIYRFQSEGNPPVPLRLKIEINTTEFFTLYGYQNHDYGIESRWFTGHTTIKTYQLEELMGTKLRALYQRLKGRDLFDLWLGIAQLNMDCEKVIDVFSQYNKANNIVISRAEFEKNLIPKMKVHEFIGDVKALLSDGINWEPEQAYLSVMNQLISRLPGQPWKGLDTPSK